MKLSKLLIVTCIALATALSVTSCKKSSSDSKLVGTWKETQSGYDINGNGIMDAGEVANDSIFTITVIFNSNGTGSEHVVIPGFIDSTLSIKKWVLQNGDKDLVMTDNTGTSVLTHINTLTSTSLITADTSKPIFFSVLVKQ